MVAKVQYCEAIGKEKGVKTSVAICFVAIKGGEVR